MATIREMAAADRPREKLLQHGAEYLTDTELVAILLRSGTAGRSVLEMAREVHETLFAAEIGGYGNVHWRDLTEIKGIGRDKAATLCAAVEFGKRLTRRQITSQQPNFGNAQTVADYFMQRLRFLDHEELHVCYLNIKNRLLHEQRLSHGGMSSSIADPRLIMREALRWRATALILVHNHPSGDPTPSPEDVELTRCLVRAGEILDVQVLDHIVIGDGVFASLHREGLMTGR